MTETSQKSVSVPQLASMLTKAGCGKDGKPVREQSLYNMLAHGVSATHGLVAFVVDADGEKHKRITLDNATRYVRYRVAKASASANV